MGGEVRINLRLQEHLVVVASLKVALDDTIDTNGRTVPLDLGKSTHRRLAENAARVCAELTGDVETLNLSRGTTRGT